MMKTLKSPNTHIEVSNTRIAYYSLWNEIFQKFEIRGKERDKLRHEIEFEALGIKKSSKNFNKRDFDICFSVARKLLKNGDVCISGNDAALDAEQGECRRYVFAIEKICESDDYISEIANDKFGVANWRTLSSYQLWQLLITVKNRMSTITKKRQDTNEQF